MKRMTGSITAYINEVGMRPLHMSDYDKAVLAIRDGEMAAFTEYSAKVPDQADALLIEAAGRPGLDPHALFQHTLRDPAVAPFVSQHVQRPGGAGASGDPFFHQRG